MTLEAEFHGPNLGYIMDLYDQYQKNPNAVDQTTRQYFAGWKSDGLSGVDLQALIGAINLAQAIRSHGYLAALLDPLDHIPFADPLLTIQFHHLHEDDLARLPASIINYAGEAENALQAIRGLRSIYSISLCRKRLP